MDNMSASKVPAEATRSVVYAVGDSADETERLDDTKTPKVTRGDVVRGKYGNGKFRVDYLEGKFWVASETIVVNLPNINEHLPTVKPAPEPAAIIPVPVSVPVRLTPPSDGIGHLIQRAVDARIAELHEQCAEIRSAIDLYERACEQAMAAQAASHNGMVRPKTEYKDGDEIEAATLLSELVAALPTHQVPQQVHAPVQPPATVTILPRREIVAAAPEPFADKVGAVLLPPERSYPCISRRLEGSGRMAMIIGGQVDPPKHREVAAMLALSMDRLLWPATDRNTNRHAVASAEIAVRNGKIEMLFVLDHLIDHGSLSLLRRACSARSIPMELVGKGGTGRFRTAISHIESVFDSREKTTGSAAESR